MATEGPLIHDGSQTTAESDLSTAITGQDSSGQFLAVKISGARLVDLATTAGESIYGILQNKPAVGQAADVGIMGVSKAMVGGTVAAGAYLTPNTAGRFILAATTAARVAVALEAGVAGNIITVAIAPANIGRNVT